VVGIRVREALCKRIRLRTGDSRVIILLVDHVDLWPCCELEIVIRPLETWGNLSDFLLARWKRTLTLLSKESFARLLAHHCCGSLVVQSSNGLSYGDYPGEAGLVYVGLRGTMCL
jgi:hypothetical protein